RTCSAAQHRRRNERTVFACHVTRRSYSRSFRMRQHSGLRMTLEDLALLSRRDRVRVALLLVALIVAIVWAAVQFMQPAPPRRIVLASGRESGLYHVFAQRYKARLARDGVTVDERMTDGAAENLSLLHDRNSGVDVAFTQGGAVAPVAE